MLILVALLLLASISFADETDIEDLGVLSERNMIVFTRGTSRADWSIFKIQFFSHVNSNTVNITTTNDFLRLADLGKLPDGRVTMGVRSICGDGHASAVILYTLDLRRPERIRPSAAIVGVIGEGEGVDVVSEIHERNVSRVIPSPPPPVVYRWSAATNQVRGAPRPLPSSEEIYYDPLKAQQRRNQ